MQFLVIILTRKHLSIFQFFWDMSPVVLDMTRDHWLQAPQLYLGYKDGRLRPREGKQIAQTHEIVVLEMRLKHRSFFLFKNVFIEVKFTKHKIKHFRVNSAFSTFTRLCDHHL